MTLMRSIAVAVLAASLLVVPAAPAQHPGAEIVVTIEGERVSVRAQDASLRAVLSAVAARAHLALRVRGEADRRVTIAIEGVDLAEAVDRLVRGDYVLTEDALVVFLSSDSERARRRAAAVSARDASGPRLEADGHGTPGSMAIDSVSSGGSPGTRVPEVAGAGGDLRAQDASRVFDTPALARDADGAATTARSTSARRATRAVFVRSRGAAPVVSQVMDPLEAERLAREVLDRAAEHADPEIAADAAAAEAAHRELVKALR